MLKLAFRNLFRHKLRTGLTLAAVVFGVVGLILSGGFVQDMLVQLRESVIHSQLGHVQVYARGYHEYGQREPFRYMLAEPVQLATKLSKLPGVEDVMQRIQFIGLLNNGRADLPIIGEGVEPEKEARLGSAIEILAGRQLEDSDRYGMLVGEGVAEALRLSTGDDATLVLTTPDGALNSLDFEVVGIMRTMSRDYDARALRISLQAAQELLLTEQAHRLVLRLTDTAATDVLRDALSERLLAQEFDIKTWYELAEFYGKSVDLYQRQFGILMLIVLVMVLLGVANSVNMTIYERTGEVGTMLALGSRNGDVFKLLLIENLLLGVLGAAIGVGVGLALAWLISQIGIPMPPPPNSNSGYTALIRPVPILVIGAFAVGVIATACAAWWPARRVLRMPVVDALRQNM